MDFENPPFALLTVAAVVYDMIYSAAKISTFSPRIDDMAEEAKCSHCAVLNALDLLCYGGLLEIKKPAKRISVYRLPVYGIETKPRTYLGGMCHPDLPVHSKVGRAAI